jgi:hypothetical protein
LVDFLEFIVRLYSNAHACLSTACACVCRLLVDPPVEV